MDDPLNAYSDASLAIDGASEGPLAGLTFAIKDLYHIEGRVTGCGNPDYAATHAPATKTAGAVTSLLAAGANARGKTHTDELAYSLNGENAHYGTPTNPNAPNRVPGGSSSGSAAVVAGGLADFALGTDTGGSVRVPGSYCGLYGLRPTHGRIPTTDAVLLAPSFCTVGFFARDPALMRRVAAVLLPPDTAAAARPPPRLLVPEDLWELASPDVAAVLEPAVAAVERRYGAATRVRLTAEGGAGVSEWFHAFRHAQGYEVWGQHGAWITAQQPAFGPGLKERFAWASTITEEQRAEAEATRARVRERLQEVLGDDGVLLMPTTPGPAPIKGLPSKELEAFRFKALQLTCPAGLGGAPQVTLPVAKVEDAPVGLSLLGPRGADEWLLEMAGAIGGVAEGGVAPLQPSGVGH